MSLEMAVTLREPWQVDRRLAELQLGTAEDLLRVARIAVGAGADATPFHPANAAGTLSYHHGTWALRNEFVGEKWKVDRPYGLEAISNEEIRVRVVFQNVDLACNDDQKPQPRSTKGSGAERASAPSLFGTLPEYAPVSTDKWQLFFLMVDADGAAELTRPVIKRGRFTHWIERLYLSRPDDAPSRKPMSLDDDDVVDDFDPEVIRK